jgi:hypothetical protein
LELINFYAAKLRAHFHLIVIYIKEVSTIFTDSFFWGGEMAAVRTDKKYEALCL